jgi:hypothetical protein
MNTPCPGATASLDVAFEEWLAFMFAGEKPDPEVRMVMRRAFMSGAAACGSMLLVQALQPWRQQIVARLEFDIASELPGFSFDTLAVVEVATWQ